MASCVAHGAADLQQPAAQIGYSRAGHRSTPITQCDPSRGPVRRQIADFALTWLTCGRTFPAAQKCRFGVGRIDSARLAAIMVLPVFQWLARTAGIAESEMLRTFNCGIGMVAVADEKNAGQVIDAFQAAGDRAVRIGKLIAGSGEAKVVYRGALKL